MVTRVSPLLLLQASDFPGYVRQSTLQLAVLLRQVANEWLAPHAFLFKVLLPASMSSTTGFAFAAKWVVLQSSDGANHFHVLPRSVGDFKVNLPTATAFRARRDR